MRYHYSRATFINNCFSSLTGLSVKASMKLEAENGLYPASLALKVNFSFGHREKVKVTDEKFFC